jgi:Photosynthesis system II assembly factor YCF48
MANLYSVRFGSATDGVAVGEGGTVLVTHDGGGTWTSHPGLTPASLRGVAFGWNGNRVVAVGDAGIVLRSTDAGETWSQMTLDPNAALLGVASDNAGELVLAVDDLGRVWKSAGGSWTFNVDTDAGAPLTSVSLSYDGSLALVAGAHGTALLRDATGGWSTVSLPTETNLHAALVANLGSQLFVAGDSGALFLSTDDGASWAAEAVRTSATLYGLDDF